MGNDRGQYGSPRIGADPTGRSITPWIIGGVGVAIVGLVVFGSHAAKQQGPRLTSHEKEIRAWEAEFPGLPWYMDQVKDSRQLDSWERARDYWERKYG